MENLKEKIERLEKELQKLKNEVNKKEKWQDKLVQPKSDNYHFIALSPFDGFRVSSSSPDSQIRRKPEHAFRTREQAELVKEKILLMQEMLAFAHVKNEGWEADWGDAKHKYGLIFYSKEVQVENASNFNCFTFGVTVKSKEIAHEMKDIFGDRIEKFYNKQY